MANVEFEGNRSSLNLTYGEDDVGFQIITDHGDLTTVLKASNVRELHESLGAWLQLRKQRMREARARKKTP